MTNFEDKQGHIERILRELISLLPSSYNKESSDTNYYKILRALSHELADARVAIETTKDNNYLETVKSDAIYNNFGTLVRLKKSAEWDDEKYRDLIRGVMQSLLIGPTKDSLVQAFKMFTSFNVQVHELYKDSDKIDPLIYAGYNPKYTFLLEIEKPVDTYADNDTIRRNANYIIGILKPAHTIGLQIINLTGDEDFRLYYNVDRQIGNLTNTLIEENISSKINSILTQNIEELIRNYSTNNNVDSDVALDTIYIRNYGKTRSEFETFLENNAQKLYNEYLNSFTNVKTNLNVNELLIPTLTIKNFRNIVYTKLLEKYNKLDKAIIVSKTEIEGSSTYEADFTIVFGENKKVAMVFNSNYNSTVGYSVEVDLLKNSIKLINLKSNTIINELIIPYNLTNQFNLKIDFVKFENSYNSRVDIYLNHNLLLSENVVAFKNWFFGLQSGRDFIEVNNFKINNNDISMLENNQFNNFWYTPTNKEIKTSYGTFYKKDTTRYLLVPGLLDKYYLSEYKDNLYTENNKSLTRVKLTQKINIEIVRLKEIYLKDGIDIFQIGEDEWFEIAENSIKESIFRNQIIHLLGGIVSLRSYCSFEASKFKQNFEDAHKSNVPYVGLDRVDVESGVHHNEGSFGWKHLSYNGQLKTTLKLDGPKIGSVYLIGPRNNLNDDSLVDFTQNSKDSIPVNEIGNNSIHNLVDFREKQFKNPKEKIDNTELQIKDKFDFSPIRFELFKINESRLNNRTTRLGLNTAYHVDYTEQIEVENSENNIPFAKNVENKTKERVDIVELSGSEFSDTKDMLTTVQTDSKTNFTIVNHDIFDFTKFRTSFVLGESILNHTELDVDEDQVDIYTVTLDGFEEDATKFVKDNVPFELNNMNSMLNSNLTLLSVESKFTSESNLEFKESYRNDQRSDSAECIMTKIDEFGNEIILQTRVI